MPLLALSIIQVGVLSKLEFFPSFDMIFVEAHACVDRNLFSTISNSVYSFCLLVPVDLPFSLFFFFMYVGTGTGST